jgi:hypothetical protein
VPRAQRKLQQWEHRLLGTSAQQPELMELDYLLQPPRESLRHRLRKSAVLARRFETFLASLTLLVS